MIGFIYKLESVAVGVNEIYVGSTGNMTVRKGHHKSDCNNSNGRTYNLRVYQYIRENGGFENFRMIELERVEYERKTELRAREQFHLKNLGASLNVCIPNRTIREWHIDNKESVTLKKKEYQEVNKESIEVYRLKYCEENKTRIRMRRKANYEANKERLKAKHSCPCGGRYTTMHQSRHFKSVRHRAHEASQSAVAE